jgi:hypothetical protein
MSKFHFGALSPTEAPEAGRGSYDICMIMAKEGQHIFARSRIFLLEL